MSDHTHLNPSMPPRPVLRRLKPMRISRAAELAMEEVLLSAPRRDPAIDTVGIARPPAPPPVLVSARRIDSHTEGRQPGLQAADNTLRPLADRVSEALQQSGHAGLAELEFAERNGLVTVRGTVDSLGARYLAINTIRQLAGVVRVIDRLTLPETARTKPSPPAFRQQVKRRARQIARSSPTAIRHAILLAVGLHIGLFTYLIWPKSEALTRPVAVQMVQGSARWNGQPMAGAKVELHPRPGSSLPANVRPTALVDASGNYKLSTFETADGAPLGDYIATVVWTKPVVVRGETHIGPNLIPVVFSQPQRSPLRITITDDTTTLPPLDLKQTGRPRSSDRKTYE
jgi:hypothetical protein